MGLRTGALLALTAARECHLERVMLCHPVESGRTYLTGLLRSRIAASFNGLGPRLTTEALRAQLAAGQSVEIMGYTLSSKLWAELEQAELPLAGSGFVGEVDWLHFASGPAGSLPQKVVDEVNRLKSTATGRIRTQVVSAPSFWTLEETPPADRVIATVSSAWLDKGALEVA
jgi:hypothetical protein